ncbi:MAG: hypothetical protein ACP5DX_15575 [Paracoccaceae bacterium]
MHPSRRPAGCGGRSPERQRRHQHDQSVFHTLLRRHHELDRQVEDLPNGIRAVTTASAPDLVALLHDHAEQMHRRLQEGFGLRHWDPAFAEIFAQKDKVRMTLARTENGVIAEETSDDPNVVKLIRAHGAVVTGFVRDGGRAAAQPSPLPPDYVRVLG